MKKKLAKIMTVAMATMMLVSLPVQAKSSKQDLSKIGANNEFAVVQSPYTPFEILFVWDDKQLENPKDVEINLTIDTDEYGGTLKENNSTLIYADDECSELAYILRPKDNEPQNWARVIICWPGMITNLTWDSGIFNNNESADCKAYLYKDGKLVKELKATDNWSRSYTGVWYFGVCSTAKGNYQPYFN